MTGTVDPLPSLFPVTLVHCGGSGSIKAGHQK